MISGISEENRKKRIAPESESTLKARKKLEKRMQEAERKITPDGLERAVAKIYQWIEKHASSRVVLKEKVCLFDQNQHAAPSSQKIACIAANLKREPEPLSKGVAGRVYENRQK